MNPGTGGVIQRRARARPNDFTLPEAASESSARCTLRWLFPRTIATTQQLGRAMIRVAQDGYPTPILEARDLTRLGAT